jgi:hypothetical protein
MGSSWLAVFDDDDRAAFFAEIRVALEDAEAAGDAAAIETCLHAWQVTAEAMSGPVAREVLTRPAGEGDFKEVPRP